MTIPEQLDADLKDAMRAKNTVALDALRGLKARIISERTSGSVQKEFTDEDIQAFVASEIKRRKDSITAYTDGGRPELAAKEQQEVDVLLKYMPEQLSEAEVRAIITSKLEGQSFAPTDFGKAMALVMPELKGKADGQLVSKILKEKLS
jgi:uncharacterized protein YqeY